MATTKHTVGSTSQHIKRMLYPRPSWEKRWVLFTNNTNMNHNYESLEGWPERAKGWRTSGPELLNQEKLHDLNQRRKLQNNRTTRPPSSKSKKPTSWVKRRNTLKTFGTPRCVEEGAPSPPASLKYGAVPNRRIRSTWERREDAEGGAQNSYVMMYLNAQRRTGLCFQAS